MLFIGIIPVCFWLGSDEEIENMDSRLPACRTCRKSVGMTKWKKAALETGPLFYVYLPLIHPLLFDFYPVFSLIK
jgi:hypothetical protein